MNAWHSQNVHGLTSALPDTDPSSLSQRKEVWTGVPHQRKLFAKRWVELTGSEQGPNCLRLQCLHYPVVSAHPKLKKPLPKEIWIQILNSKLWSWQYLYQEIWQS